MLPTAVVLAAQASALSLASHLQWALWHHIQLLRQEYTDKSDSSSSSSSIREERNRLLCAYSARRERALAHLVTRSVPIVEHIARGIRGAFARVRRATFPTATVAAKMNDVPEKALSVCCYPSARAPCRIR